jgi:hypothetical protein
MYVPRLDTCAAESSMGPSCGAVAHMADVGGSPLPRCRLFGGVKRATIAAGRFGNSAVPTPPGH